MTVCQTNNNEFQICVNEQKERSASAWVVHEQKQVVCGCWLCAEEATSKGCVLLKISSGCMLTPAVCQQMRINLDVCQQNEKRSRWADNKANKEDLVHCFIPKESVHQRTVRQSNDESTGCEPVTMTSN